MYLAEKIHIRWCGSMAEQLIRNEQVAGSIPVTSSRKKHRNTLFLIRMFQRKAVSWKKDGQFRLSVLSFYPACSTGCTVRLPIYRK